jgi:hypothetical protein
MQDIRAKATYDAYADLLLNEQQVNSFLATLKNFA